MSTDKLWGGRFQEATDAAVDAFNASLACDCRMVEQDILGSIAHATMLGEQNIITKTDAVAIVEGLNALLNDLNTGAETLPPDAEDVHMAVEALLTRRIGEAGKRLHTGRSRNDQVALDLRMYVKDAIVDTRSAVFALINALITIAKANTDAIMPGYTHLQRAQPITLAHHVLAYVEMFMRDHDRMKDAFTRADVMPLGSGALAGTTYPLNRARVAQLLNFASITRNSLDAVSDRDFAIEYVSALSMLMMHLSRFCEEIILWASHEFGFVTLSDAYSTGSSIMPQKKNPDVAELIRGKTGRVYGDLTTLLTLMKGLPLAYNKDMQEDKPALFDAHDTSLSCVTLFIGMMNTLKFNTDRMNSVAERGFTNATDAADYLVKMGLPFRDAHAVIGRMVLSCEGRGIGLNELTLAEYRAFSPLFTEDIYAAISLKTCVDARNIPGAPGAVNEALKYCDEWIKGIS